MSSGPLVSVILETANPTTRTAAAIRSVIDQTYQNWELIVVADSSGRESGLNLDEIAVTDSRIRVVRSKGNVDRGKYERRNEA
ncbi:UNVERIFIED_CONTAM: glycosyltransferase, partial [Salmonella enterica subsp. enterica serovar Weltevreden]